MAKLYVKKVPKGLEKYDRRVTIVIWGIQTDSGVAARGDYVKVQFDAPNGPMTWLRISDTSCAWS